MQFIITRLRNAAKKHLLIRKTWIMICRIRSVICRTWLTIKWCPILGYGLVREKFKKDVCICECWVHFAGYKFKKNNWGDDLNLYLFELLSKKKFIFIPLSRTYLKTTEWYMGVGSILGMYPLEGAIVCGSGFIRPYDSIEGHPRKIACVRGPLTRKELLRHGIDCEENYGDLALVLPLVYKSTIQKEYPISLIPNMGTSIDEIKSYIDVEEYHVISMMDYEQWTDIVDEICKSELVLSESLHGLIVAEAYGVPSVWVEFINHENMHNGCWDFKFIDFYQSIGKDYERGVRLYESRNISEAIDEGRKWEKANIDYEKIISYLPFEVEIRGDEKRDQVIHIFS